LNQPDRLGPDTNERRGTWLSAPGRSLTAEGDFSLVLLTRQREKGYFTLRIGLTAALSACALAAQSVPPAPADLIARAIAAQNAQTARGWKYTYREDHEQQQLDKNGKPDGPPSSKTFDHIMLEGENYSKLILIDGKPLDAKTQKKVDAELEKTRTERRGNHLLSLHRTVSLGGPDVLARLFDNKVTSEETISGHKTWRVESEPKSGYNPVNKGEEEALAARRVSWFDQEDGLAIKETNIFVRATNSFQPGTIFEFDYMKVGDDWVLADAVMHVESKMMPGVHGRVESHQRYSEYKRFSVDSALTAQ
jgi:hypothetical protein